MLVRKLAAAAAVVGLFIPIQRMERTAEGLIVEGFSFVNARVGDGYNLKRSAMEAASSDYMNWGCVREMHDKTKASGTTLHLDWTDRGAFHRCLVVDSEAIKKCETGVYKGFSVGVLPTVMRGQDVEQCVWTEISLVDRPADPDARFSIGRADADVPAEVSIQVYEAGEEIPAPGLPHVQRAAFVADIQRALAEPTFRDAIMAAVRAEFKDLLAIPAEVSRLAGVVKALPTTVVIERADFDSAMTRIDVLEKKPASVNLPLLSPGGDRAITNPAITAPVGDVATLTREYAALDTEIQRLKIAEEDTAPLVAKRSAVLMVLRSMNVQV